MKKLTRLILCLSSLFYAPLAGQAQAFVHPGIYNTKAELDFVKAKIAANEQPWKGAYDRIKASVNTNFTPQPIANIKGDGPKFHFLRDSDQAYNFALLWYFSGNQTYANKAIQIFNAWSIFKTSEKGLDTEWASSDLIPAAEIIEYSNAGWKAADITKFKTMVKTYLIPAINSNKSNSDNRRTTGIRTMLGISVFLDDRKAFDTWIDDWKYYTPIYVLDNGQSKETCRDQHHVVYGLEGVFQGAETAWIQGVDLYALEKTRLTKFLELFSGWARGTVPIPSNVCTSSTTTYNVHPGIAPCRSKGSQFKNPPCKIESNLTFDKVYFHYKNMGVSLPYTLAYNNFYREHWDRKCLQDYITSSITPTNIVGPTGYKYVTEEQGTVSISDVPHDIAYGQDGKYTYLENQTENVSCDNAAFGSDPFPGTKKYCFIKESKVPYSGSPIAIPGILEAEHYDFGGANVSYSDSDSENKGAEFSNFRVNDGVDIGTGTGGNGIGWTADGEWTEYSVDIESTGDYNLAFVVASKNGGGKLGLDLDGTPLLTDMAVPQTNDWDSYTSFSEKVSLNAGEHVIRFNVEKSGFNLDKIEMSKAVTTGLYDEISSLSVYPNPSTSGEFHLSAVSNWEVFTLQGVSVTSGQSDVIKLTGESKRVYLLKVNNHISKLVIQ